MSSPRQRKAREPRPTDEWPFVEALLADPSVRTIFLFGAAGIGKTYCAYHNGRTDAGIYPITLTPETPASELVGHFFPAGQELRWRDGPFTLALRAGGRLVINEISHASSDVLAILYPVLESAATARLQLPDGQVVRPAPGFHAVITDNESPDNLPAALQDRFDCLVHIKTPHPDALALLHPKLRRAALRAMILDDERRVTMRQWLNISRFMEAMGLDGACRAVLGRERGAQIFDALLLANDAETEDEAAHVR
jgi:MoxR-like ATPase